MKTPYKCIIALFLIVIVSSIIFFVKYDEVERKLYFECLRSGSKLKFSNAQIDEDDNTEFNIEFSYSDMSDEEVYNEGVKLYKIYKNLFNSKKFSDYSSYSINLYIGERAGKYTLYNYFVLNNITHEKEMSLGLSLEISISTITNEFINICSFSTDYLIYDDISEFKRFKNLSELHISNPNVSLNDLCQIKKVIDNCEISYVTHDALIKYLYNSNDDGSIDNVFSWEPTTKQWWITGFNPEYVGEVDVHDLTMVGCIDMSDNVSNNKKDACDRELFEKLKEQYDLYSNNNNRDDRWNNMYLDSETYTVWICWGN